MQGTRVLTIQAIFDAIYDRSQSNCVKDAFKPRCSIHRRSLRHRSRLNGVRLKAYVQLILHWCKMPAWVHESRRIQQRRVQHTSRRGGLQGVLAAVPPAAVIPAAAAAAADPPEATVDAAATPAAAAAA